MAKRGRASAASVSMSGLALPVISVDRIQPEGVLSDAETAVWRSVVNDHSADSFTPAHAAVLELYCRHVVRSRLLADEISAFDMAWLADEDGLKRYDKLLSMAERESRTVSALARSLRITRQSIHPVTAGRSNANQKKSPKPWQILEHDD